jgi:hypothetical protein
VSPTAELILLVALVPATIALVSILPSWGGVLVMVAFFVIGVIYLTHLDKLEKDLDTIEEHVDKLEKDLDNK